MNIEETLEYLKKNYVGKLLARGGHYGSATKLVESVEYVEEKKEFFFNVLELQYDWDSLVGDKYVIKKVGMRTYFDGTTHVWDIGMGPSFETEIPDYHIVTNENDIQKFNDILKKQEYLTSKNGVIVTKDKIAAFINEFDELVYGTVEGFDEEQKCLIIRMDDVIECKCTNVIYIHKGNRRYYKKSCEVVIA